jgi:hypothetical protein
MNKARVYQPKKSCFNRIFPGEKSRTEIIRNSGLRIEGLKSGMNLRVVAWCGEYGAILFAAFSLAGPGLHADSRIFL